MTDMSDGAPRILWTPDPARTTTLHAFIDWLAAERDVRFEPRYDYRALWRWSVEELSEFWDAVRAYHDVIGEGFEGPALAEERMPGSVWYPDARLNLAENVLRWALDPAVADETAIVDIDEDDAIVEITWAELRRRTLNLARCLRSLGVTPGDRVAAVLPNIPEAIIGLLATATLGAVWTISSPELSPTATLGRLRQLAPTILIGTRGYRFNGRELDLTAPLREIADGLPSVTRVLTVDDLREAMETDGEPAAFHRVPFAHPLWVLFSSGTTGDPKGIVHGHGGIVLEALKGVGLNQNMAPGDRYYVSANTSWMVWNTLTSNLAVGASVVTYAGSPKVGGEDRHLRVLALTGATRFATGSAYLALVEKSGLVPSERADFSRLRSILATGSPLAPSTAEWVYRSVASDIHLGSDSGGTDICSGFIGSNMLEPVHLGEIQGPLLGVDVQAWNDRGERVIGKVGEMIIRRPMPSMPIELWNDPDGSRYRETYFSLFPGAWAQGDWIHETERGGFVVHGRSDATLNRDGVRLGSSEIYAALQEIPEVIQSTVLGIEHPGGYHLPLFVQLREGTKLTDELRERIVATIRRLASPRHVPDEIVPVPGIPMTHAGKRIEVPLKKLFTGRALADAVNLGSLSNPETVDRFVEEARRFRENHDLNS